MMLIQVLYCSESLKSRKPKTEFAICGCRRNLYAGRACSVVVFSSPNWSCKTIECHIWWAFMSQGSDKIYLGTNVGAEGYCSLVWWYGCSLREEWLDDCELDIGRAAIIFKIQKIFQEVYMCLLLLCKRGRNPFLKMSKFWYNDRLFMSSIWLKT